MEEYFLWETPIFIFRNSKSVKELLKGKLERWCSRIVTAKRKNFFYREAIFHSTFFFYPFLFLPISFWLRNSVRTWNKSFSFIAQLLTPQWSVFKNRIWKSTSFRPKVKSVQEPCAKFFADHILKSCKQHEQTKQKTSIGENLKTKSLMFFVRFFSCDLQDFKF